MSDPDEMKELMLGAGFNNVTVENIRLEGSTASAEDAAKGFVLGNPMYNILCERNETLVPDILSAVQKNFTNEFGQWTV